MKQNSLTMWTDREAAQLLRCSRAKVKHLRLSRQLGYYPGRPALISQDDLQTYVASVKIIKIPMPDATEGYVVAPADTRPRAFRLLTRIEAARLIRCSLATIQRLCSLGKLPFLPGRGSTIDEADIRDFILANNYVPDTEQKAALEAARLPDHVIEEIREEARRAAIKHGIVATIELRRNSNAAGTSDLLLQSEVERLLRRSRATVTRLRQSGKLAYYKGRPNLIARADLERYVASIKIRRISKKTKTGTQLSIAHVNGKPGPFKLLTRPEAARAFGRSVVTIRSWCLRGKIAYVPGRPGVVDEGDIVAYLAERQRKREMRAGPAPGSPEFDRAEKEKAFVRMRQRLRIVSLRRRMPGILERARRYGRLISDSEG